MTIPVYSTQLVSLQGLNGTHSANPPSGFVWVVRDIDAFYNGLVVSSIHVIGDNLQTFWYNGFAAGGNPQYASFRGRQVLKTLLRVTTDQSQDVTISGYQLSLP